MMQLMLAPEVGGEEDLLKVNWPVLAPEVGVEVVEGERISLGHSGLLKANWFVLVPELREGVVEEEVNSSVP